MKYFSVNDLSFPISDKQINEMNKVNNLKCFQVHVHYIVEYFANGRQTAGLAVVFLYLLQNSQLLEVSSIIDFNSQFYSPAFFITFLNDFSHG